MKIRLTYITILSTLFMISSHTQENEGKTSHYVFPEFTEGTILMKDGSTLTQSLNYNSLSENFAYKEGEAILGLSEYDINRVDTVYISNRKFFRKDDVFLELLMKGDVELYIEYKCNLESSTAASGGYGGTSQTTSGRSASTIENKGFIYQLELPEIYKAKPFKRYWIKKENAFTKFKTIGQLKKLYKDKKKEIKSYRKSHRVDITDPDSIKQLVIFLESD